MIWFKIPLLIVEWTVSISAAVVMIVGLTMSIYCIIQAFKDGKHRD